MKFHCLSEFTPEVISPKSVATCVVERGRCPRLLHCALSGIKRLSIRYLVDLGRCPRSTTQVATDFGEITSGVNSDKQCHLIDISFKCVFVDFSCFQVSSKNWQLARYWIGASGRPIDHTVNALYKGGQNGANG